MGLSIVDQLAAQAMECRLCEASLPHEPRPVFQVGAQARVLIVGQAPGARVHRSGVAWADRSGDRLRDWLGVDEASFYDPRRFALVPMGLCFPGRGASGDRPPRPECAPRWMGAFVDALTERRLTILIGRYAHRYFLEERAGSTVTQTVSDWRRYRRAGYFVLPHPSPRNGIWLRKNPWFAEELVPRLRIVVRRSLA